MRLKSVIENIGAFTSESILIADVDLRDGAVMVLRWCNPAFTALTGYSLEDIFGKTARILVGPDTDPAKHLEIIDLLMNWDSFITDMKTNRKDGTPYWVEMSWQPLRDESGKFRYWICVLRDITARKKSAVALSKAYDVAEKAELRLRSAIESLSDPFVIYDSEDNLVLCNSKYLHLSEAGEEAVLGKTYEEILRASVGRGEILDAVGREEEWVRERLLHHKKPSDSLEIEFTDGRIFKVIEQRTPEDDIVKLHVDITEIKIQQRNLKRYAEALEEANRLAVKRNLELEQAKELIEFASLHDALTGLANRRYLDQMLQTRATPSSDVRPFVVLHIDIDRFKQINDAFGHHVGDNVLIHVAKILNESIGKTDFVARVGGDEFVVLSDSDESDPDGTALAGRIGERLRVPFLHANTECRFSASIGIAKSPGKETDPAQLLINADIALYRAKELGRNKWTFFTEQLQAETLEFKKTADDILRAFENDEFIAFYQPQFDACTLELVGVEALVRWQHPERGLLPPIAFMKVADDMNLVKDIDRLVLQRAVQDKALWEGEGVHVPKISINASWHRLKEQEFINDIRTCGIDPATLSVELHESIFIDDADELLHWNIDQLREMGVTIELDDFGTGHSSIVGLINLEPTRLKIDRKFVMPLTKERSSQALLKFIVDIGRSLNVEVVAEGVETQEHVDILRELGCDILQGFFFSRPVSVRDLCRFVKSRAWMPRRLEPKVLLKSDAANGNELASSK